MGVNCGFWRTSGRFRGTFGVDSWYLGFSSVFWVDPVLFGAIFDVFWVSVGFCWVLVCRKCKWEWIVGFGEDQVSFGWFSWEFLSFCCFFF